MFKEDFNLILLLKLEEVKKCPQSVPLSHVLHDVK